MDKWVSSLVVFLLAGLVSSQYEQGRGFQHGDRPPANILLHKQALGQDGSFNYAFAADNGLQQGEVINPDGSRKGSYSYVDPNGKTVTLAYTAGKDGFKVLSGDHLPKAPEPSQPRTNPQLYQQQPAHYPQPPLQEPRQPALFRPEPIPFEAYRNSPNAPVYRGSPEQAYARIPPQHRPHPHPQPQYAEPPYGSPPQAFPHAPAPAPAPAPHYQRPVPQYQPRQYSVQEEKPSYYTGQPFRGDYLQEDPRKPHSFGNGYSFEFAG